MPAGSTYTPIATTTLGSAQATITFNSFSGYTDLVLVSSYKRTATSNARVRFNSDTGNNYSYTALQGNGTTASSTRVSNVSGILLFDPLSASTTNFLTSILHIQNYSNSTTYKTVLDRSGDAAQGAIATVGLWRNTAAITSFTLDANTGNYDIGSTFTLYGIASA